MAAFGHAAHRLCHLGKLRQIQVGEHAADSLLSYLSEVSVGLGDWIIDIYLVQQELGGVISSEHTIIGKGDVAVNLHQLLQEHWIDHKHTIQLGTTPPRRALPNRAHTFGTA